MKLQLSLRDLFWVTIVVAMSVGWWLDRQRLGVAEERRNEVETRAGVLTERLREARLNWQSLHDAGDKYNLIERDENGNHKIRDPYRSYLPD
jgi:hypothetical protein